MAMASKLKRTYPDSGSTPFPGPKRVKIEAIPESPLTPSTRSPTLIGTSRSVSSASQTSQSESDISSSSDSEDDPSSSGSDSSSQLSGAVAEARGNLSNYPTYARSIGSWSSTASEETSSSESSSDDDGSTSGNPINPESGISSHISSSDSLVSDSSSSGSSSLSLRPSPKPRSRRPELTFHNLQNLHSRIAAFIPKLQRANEDLDRKREVGASLEDHNIEALDDEERYIEMDLGLGVLEEKKTGMEVERDSESRSGSGSGSQSGSQGDGEDGGEGTEEEENEGKSKSKEDCRARRRKRELNVMGRLMGREKRKVRPKVEII